MNKVNFSLSAVFSGLFFILLINIVSASVIIVAPTNGTNYSSTALFNVTYINGTDIINPTNVTFYYNKSAALTFIGNISTCAQINVTSGWACWGTLTVSGLTNGRYSLNATIWNGSTNANSTNVISVVTFDSTGPLINITYPFKNGLNSTRNGNLSINYSVSDALVGVQSCWWTNNSGLSNKTVNCGTNITGENFTDGLKTIIVYTNDSLNNINYSTIQFGVDTTVPNVSTPNLPLTGGNYSGIQLFSASINDTTAGIQNAFFYVINYNGSQQANYTATFVSGTTWVANVTTSSHSDGIYNISIYANDSVNNLNSTTKVINITFDNTAPTTPVLSDLITTTSSVTATITVSDSLSGIGRSCSADRAGARISGTGGSQTLTETNLACGSVYYYIITCSDLAGNGATSSTYSYTTSNCDSGGLGGFGGGGATISGTTYIPSAQNLDEGYTKQLAVNDKIKVPVSAEMHYVMVKSITEAKATISIMSNETILILGSGQDGKVDVNNDGYYDIYVKLNSISNSQAELFVQKINELIPQGQTGVTTTGEIGELEQQQSAEKTTEANKYLIWIVVIIVAIAIVIIALNVKKIKKRK